MSPVYRHPNRRISRRPTALVVAGLIAASVSNGFAQENATLQEAFPTRDTGLEQPNTLLAVDLFNDETPEIVATDVRGTILLLNGATGETILRGADPAGKALTDPVVGEFANDKTLDIVAGTQDGRVVVFDGSTLALKAERKLGGAITVPPTVVALPSPEVQGADCDVVLVVSEDGKLYAQFMNQKGLLQDYFPAVPAGAKMVHPVTVGRVRGASGLEIVVPSADGNVYIVDAATGAAKGYLMEENRGIGSAVLLADFTGDGLDDLVFTMESNGDITFRTWDADNDRFSILTTIPTGNNKPQGDPVLAMTYDGSPASPKGGLIFQGGLSTLGAINPANPDPAQWAKQYMAGNPKEYQGINTPLTLIVTEYGLPALAFGAGTTAKLVRTDSWFQEKPALVNPTYQVGEALDHAMVSVSAPGKEGKRELNLVGITSKGRLIGVRTGLNPVAATPNQWMTRGGTPRHGSFFDKRYFERDRSRREALAAALQERVSGLAAAKDQGEWGAALEAAKWLADFDPLNVDHQKEYKRVWFRKNIFWIVLGTVTGLLLAGYISFVVLRFLYLRNLERMAKGALGREKFEEAQALYEKLHAKLPHSARITATLAMVYVARGNTDARTIPIYQKALALDPQKQNVLHAYAGALLHAETFDAKAREIYMNALKTFPEPPMMEFAIGMCHKAAGEFDEAGKRLRAAMRGGVATPAIHSALCDIYVQTNNRSSKALSVYQHQFATRQNDQKFLELYLDACIDAKLSDPTVESLCFMVLDGNPRNVPAHCQLATMYLQKSETGRAIDEIRIALEFDPANGPAMNLLAQCYLIEGRTDDQAQTTFRKALKAQPNNPELLRTLADLYYRANRYDGEAVEVYNRSALENPNDVPTLKALAETAKLSANHDLAIRALESLQHLGPLEPRQSVQLAQSYAARGIFEPRTEKVMRDALRVEPGNGPLAAALAKVLAMQAREDAESIPVYEAHLRLAPHDRQTGTQLVRAFVKNTRYADALRLAQELLRAHPQDGELQSLVALASLYGNRIDDAVQEYEQILARNPNDQEAQLHLALGYAQKSRVDDDAARLYQRALAVQPNNPDLYLAMGRVHVSRGDSVKAVECYQQILKVRPGSEEILIRHLTAILAQHGEAVRVRWFLCEVLVAHGRLRDALEQLNVVYESQPNQAKNILGALDKILAKDPKNVQTMTMKGQLLAATGDFDGARKTLEAAYKINPSGQEIVRQLTQVYEGTLAKKEDAEARFRLGRMLYMNQEYDKAIGCFQKTAQDYRWEAESTKMLGKCFTAKGMLDLALQEFKKLVVDEETKELLYDLAQRYEGKKDLVGAKTVYRQLFAADIDYKDVKTRFEMLSGSTSDPMAFEKTNIVQAMSEDAKRRYELLDELGRGAMGIVYRARDKELEEVVALKILPDSMSNNPEAVRRFKIEARNARKLSHPNIVRIHDIGEEMGRKYISMEYVDGSDLKKKLKTKGKFALPEFFHYGIQIAEALSYAHHLGIVHRDIKPANIMLTGNDDVKVTDFGIAKMLDSTGEGTMMGAVIGTPLYMSPEQVQGIPVDNRADLYSYGIMLYEFINGRPAFTEGDLAYQHIHKAPTPPADCPDPIWQIIKKCLEKSKEDRWENAAEIVEALKAAKKALKA